MKSCLARKALWPDVFKIVKNAVLSVPPFALYAPNSYSHTHFLQFLTFSRLAHKCAPELIFSMGVLSRAMKLDWAKMGLVVSTLSLPFTVCAVTSCA